MNTEIPNGTPDVIAGVNRVYYDGYWIKAYKPPADSLQAKKTLIQALTRRLFNHVEHGINIPGKRLNEAREAYEQEQDPERKRVKGAMLAGAMFNRATDIFTKLVEMQELGIEIESDNALMRECGVCLHEALMLGRMVRHRSGEEGIDELWGEPFRAFSIPVEAFYESRYIKIAQTLRDIDRIASVMVDTFASDPLFVGIDELVRHFTDLAKDKCETLRTDSNLFDVWAEFVVSSERLAAFAPHLPDDPDPATLRRAADGMRLILQGRDLLNYISRARVTMPKSRREYFERCEHYARIFAGLDSPQTPEWLSAP
ncbi:MAG: hypothetical protein CVU19_14175 [Betaproteobacteria bacterium HGW-Betaproteobacteria-13]|jgi:hypothetical protein|nr:MAG: hypothetical protein CVU25_00225 [Betaproteobacteria bacterium HGW-Betaproteobacteria-19]PKO80114.1 MAG: hypothetical protein CVU19_14175 [Betaproteobacteria bacterium HGW-Betaproteobacteria-13]